MSSPLVQTEEKNYMKNIKRGLLWGGLVVGTLFVGRQVRKDLPPINWHVTIGVAVAANVVSFAIDIGKVEGWLPDYV